MAQFKKEEVFGPPSVAGDAVRDQPGVENVQVGESERQPPGQSSSPPPDESFLDWATRHRRLAIVGAFGVGVFLGAVVRR